MPLYPHGTDGGEKSPWDEHVSSGHAHISSGTFLHQTLFVSDKVAMKGNTEINCKIFYHCSERQSHPSVAFCFRHLKRNWCEKSGNLCLNPQCHFSEWPLFQWPRISGFCWEGHLMVCILIQKSHSLKEVREAGSEAKAKQRDSGGTTHHMKTGLVKKQGEDRRWLIKMLRPLRNLTLAGRSPAAHRAIAAGGKTVKERHAGRYQGNLKVRTQWLPIKEKGRVKYSHLPTNLSLMLQATNVVYTTGSFPPETRNSESLPNDSWRAQDIQSTL